MSQLNRNQLLQIFSEILEVDPRTLSEDSSPENVEGWDSAKSMEVVVLLEEALGIDFSASEVGEMISIGATKEVLIRRRVWSPDDDREATDKFSAP